MVNIKDADNASFDGRIALQTRMSSGIIAATILCLISYGCSGNNAATVVPEPLFEIPQPQVENKTNRILLGMWEIGFDSLENAISITPVRYGSAHYNITDMLMPPACDDCLEIAVNS